MYRQMKIELQTYGPELNPLQCGLRLNRSYQRLLDMHMWSFIKREALFSTVAIYNTGTVTTTSGSTTVTGNGTAFTAAMANRFIKVDGQPEFYKISTVDVGLQTLTLEAAVGVGATTAGYNIFQHQYSKPTSCKYIINVRRQLSLGERTKEWLDGYDPDRDGTGEPIYYANFDDDTLELYPVPDSVYTLRVGYILAVADMSAETDVPILSEQLIITHATKQLYRQLAANAEKAQHYLQLYQVAKDDFAELWKAEFEKDLKRQSIPSCVADNLGGQGGMESDQFWIQRDPYWAGLP